MLTLLGHDNWVNGIVFLQSGKHLVSVSDDKSMRIWDLSNGRCFRKITEAHSHFVTTIDVRGKTVVTGSVDAVVKLWQCR